MLGCKDSSIERAVTNSAQHCSFDQFQHPCQLIHEMLHSTLSFTYLTVFARVSFRTGAVVLIWLRVYAGASIHAGMVRSTVVQICMGNKNTSHPFAHKSKPQLLKQAGLKQFHQLKKNKKQTILNLLTLPVNCEDVFFWERQLLKYGQGVYMLPACLIW